MNWGMQILSPSSYFTNSSWLIQESSISTRWTAEENKAFENALALFDEKTPDRWQKVAAMVPGKTVGDVIRQYKELEDDVSSIEAGLIPIPGYDSLSPFTLDWGGSGCDGGYDGFKQPYGRKTGSGRATEHERKKGVPWSEEEHKLFLMGLKKYGKGDWRNISRNFVITRTPTQVASHAQKYFMRQLSGGKDKRRASIHDITTVNLNDDQTHSPDSKRLSSPDQKSSAIQELPFQWTNETTMGYYSPGHDENIYVSPEYGVNLCGLRMHDLYNNESNLGSSQYMGFHYPDA